MRNIIRKPIITVLGHVDSGKTRTLDAIRGTSIIDKEAGGITQHIGATEVPINVIKKISGALLQKYGFNLSIPGLLFIDTPGHEAFTNLRKRGSSIADLAVLVIDINKGCQEQTFEAIEILKSFKVPFIIAANKTDAIFEWNSVEGSITDSLQQQSSQGLDKLDRLVYTIVGQLHERGFQSERFDRVNDFTKQIPIIPCSAKTKEGFPEILMFLAGLSQKYLEKQLKISVEGPGKGTILEVREEKGLGKTVDVILYDGTLKVGDRIALGGKEGVIESKVRALLEPKPLDEIRDPEKKFSNVKEVSAAAGVKIVATNLNDALAGSPLIVVSSEEDIVKLQEEIKSIKIDSDAIGPILKTDTLGSLEAIALMLEKEGLKIRKADVGDLNRKDLIEAETIKEKDKFKGVIFVFNGKVDSEIEKEAEKKGLKIFKSNVVYSLIDGYKKWMEEEKQKEKTQKLSSIIYPAEFKILPGNVFRNSKPAVVGVHILRGKLKTDINVMNSEGKIVGKIRAIQSEGKVVKEALQGDEVAVSIDDAVVDRTIKEKEILYTFIPKNQFTEIETFLSDFTEDEKELLNQIKLIELKIKA